MCCTRSTLLYKHTYMHVPYITHYTHMYYPLYTHDTLITHDTPHIYIHTVHIHLTYPLQVKPFSQQQHSPYTASDSSPPASRVMMAGNPSTMRASPWVIFEPNLCSGFRMGPSQPICHHCHLPRHLLRLHLGRLLTPPRPMRVWTQRRWWTMGMMRRCRMWMRYGGVGWGC